MKIKQDEYTVPPLWLLEREGLTAAEFSEARTVLVNCRLSLCDDERNGHSGRIHSPPGRKPPAQLRINNVTETAGWNLARGTPSFWPGLSYRPPGSLLESRGGSILPRAEAPARSSP